MNGATRTAFLLSASIAALGLAQAVRAEDVSPAAMSAAAAQASGGGGSVTSARLNPTGRTIVLTVPAKDGATYLGDIPLTIAADDTLSFPSERALQLLEQILDPDVAKALRESLGTKGEIGPADLAPSGVVVVYDPQTLELRFQIPVERRASRSVAVSPMDRARFGEIYQPQDFSAYLNIRGSLDYVEDGFETGFAEPVMLLDGAARIGPVVAESDAIWIPGTRGTDFQRLGSRLVYDDTKRLIRFTAGDLETTSRGFQTSPDIAGISLFRSYSVLNPQQIIRPRGDRQFRLDRPSTVEVIVNGQQVRRLQLAPGNYDLRDFPFTQGSNDIRLNVLDDAGRTEVLRFNIFLDQTQLAKGLSEFGLYAGVKAPLGVRGPDYSDEWIASGFYRRGINDYLTLGANFQADEQTQMAGVEGVVATGIGTIGFNAAFSHTDGIGDGHAFQATFQRQIQRGNGQSDTFNLFAETRSRKFAPVTFFLPDNPYEFEVGGGYQHSFNSDFYAGVDARFSKGRDNRPDVHSYRVTTGWRLNEVATLTTEGRYEKDSRGDEFSAFLSLTIRLGRYSSARMDYDTRDHRARASFQTLQGSGVGSYNLSADVERSEFGSGLNFNGNYFSNRAELGLSHFGTFAGDFGQSLNQRTSFRLGTSLAIAGDQFSIGRPIYDSFAVVKPHKRLKGADVIVEPTSFGYTANTGTLGTATMPSLSSYAERTVTVDVANAPAGTDIGQGSFRVFPPYRSGFLLEVGSDYGVTALGTMIDADGQPVALVSGTATELAHPERPPVTLFTNRQGRFGATGLAPGQWKLEMLDEKKSVYLIDIPETADGIIRLGQIAPAKGQ
jgi:outer membrane usher protein